MSPLGPGSRYVGPRGPSSARIMIVGEAPGANEERLSSPFVGPAGQLLEDMLLKSGINPADVWCTNLCKYRPPNNELRTWFSDSGTPNDIVSMGLAELATEIQSVNPNLIIPVGNYPNSLLTGNGNWSKDNGWTGIGGYRGYVVSGGALAGGRKCLPTYHPAAILRNYSDKPVAKLDFRRAAQESQFPEIRRPCKYFLLDPRGNDREAWIEWLVSPEGTLSPPFQWNRGTHSSSFSLSHIWDETNQTVRVPSGPFLSADIEYPSNKLVCCGLTRHPDVGVCLATYDQRDIEELSMVLTSGVPQCWQNGMFDASILHWHYGIDIYPFIKHDTFLMMHTVYTEFSRDLGFIASVFGDCPPPWHQTHNSSWWKRFGKGDVPWTDLLDYNCYDVTQTHEAALKMLSDELVEGGIWRETYNFEMSLVHPLYKISRRGVRINIPAMMSLGATLEEEAMLMQQAIGFLNDGRPINVNAPTQVADFLFKRMKVPPGSMTKTSTREKPRYAVGDAVLADCALKCKDANQLQAISLVRGAKERLSLRSKFTNIDLDDDGRMRCHYDVGKTQTRRLASRQFYPTGRGANLQNVPKDTRVRSVFIPDDGYVFGYADLKSAESLVVAHLSGDPEMLRLHSPEYMTGGRDGHKFVAAFLFDKKIEDITGEERYIGKRTRHASNYMLGWHKLMTYINADADTTGVSINAAASKAIVYKYRQLHPFLVQWWNETEAELVSNGMRLADCFENPHQFYGRRDEILPNAVAFRPQGTIGVTLNLGLLKVDSSKELAELDFQMLLQVHDAIGFQSPASTLREIVPRLVECMTVEVPIRRPVRTADEMKRSLDGKTLEYNITIPVDVKLGMNWGDAGKDNPNGLVDWEKFLERTA